MAFQPGVIGSNPCFNGLAMRRTWLHDARCSGFDETIVRTTFRDAWREPERKPICAVNMKARCSGLPQAAAIRGNRPLIGLTL